MKPYFSVITPSFNQGAFIGGCLQSVAGQGDPDYEHWIFDNCSTDSTAEVISHHPLVQCVREPDRGQSDAVNKGFLAAKGEIICWLNSDDAYPPGLFERLRKLFSDAAVDVVFGDVEQIAYDGSAAQRAVAVFQDRLDLVRWWSSRARLHQPAIFFRRSVRASTGLLREDLHYAMDYEYWWRMSEHHTFTYIPEILAIQHRQPESKTILTWQKVHDERAKIFAPFYGLIDGGDAKKLRREKRRAMGQRYVMEAFSAADSNTGSALRLLGRAFVEHPQGVFDPAWIGVLRRCACPRSSAYSPGKQTW